MKKVLFAILISIIFVSCATKKYKLANIILEKRVDSLKVVIRKKEEIPFIKLTTLDSLKNIISKKDTFQLTDSTKTEFLETVNFNIRKPNFVIIHHTAQDSLQETIRTFSLKSTQVSSHYVIAKNGKVIQMLNDYLRAWHAGAGSWGKSTDINSTSIGIELDNNGDEPFSDTQINSLLVLLSKLKKDYNIPTQNFIGHSDIAPTRKNDPSVFFPWQKLAENGFGIWNNGVLDIAPPNFDTTMALRVIGYDVKNLSDAIKAFKLHYVQKDVTNVMNKNTIDLIYTIYLKQ
jgi:N-acetylmuramoyl-L-alanine amidase